MTAPRPRVLVVQHEDDAPPAWFGQWLLEAGARLDVRRPYRGEPLPAELAAHDALVVLGGDMSATSDELEWIPRTRALIVRAAETAVPTLGICLGHQLCAVALGGTSGRNPRGQQLGVQPVAWSPQAPADPLFGSASGAAIAVHWNDDIVHDPPPSSTVLARGPHGEVQAARFARTVWGVQLHPEVDEGIVAAWAALPGGARERHRADVVDAALARIAANRAELHAAWRPLALCLVALARGDGVRAERATEDAAS